MSFASCLRDSVQTVKFYRRAILPLPRSMTKYLDEFRKNRDRSSSSGDWVFVNSLNVPYNPSEALLPCALCPVPCCLTPNPLRNRPVDVLCQGVLWQAHAVVDWQAQDA